MREEKRKARGGGRERERAKGRGSCDDSASCDTGCNDGCGGLESCDYNSNLLPCLCAYLCHRLLCTRHVGSRAPQLGPHSFSSTAVAPDRAQLLRCVGQRLPQLGHLVGVITLEAPAPHNSRIAFIIRCLPVGVGCAG